MTASSGLHHITAIASNPKRNVAFYTQTLGLRLVKKTVNFDDPGTYHLYYGDAAGRPGTILTFFPWADARRGSKGAGEAVETAFLIPIGSAPGWHDRLAAHGVATAWFERFGQTGLVFSDPDGMRLSLVEGAGAGTIGGYAAAGVAARDAIRGLAGLSLLVDHPDATARVLSEALGWRQTARVDEDDATRIRFSAAGDTLGQIVDLVKRPGSTPGRMGAGSVHHVAFRAAGDADQVEVGKRLAALGIATTEQKDRTYFRSIYFREPSHVLFEIATDDPGFAIDETPEQLGLALKLPPQYEPLREKIEAVLPSLA